MLKVLALFTGANINVMSIGNHGWGILLGWLFWIIIVFVILDLINLKYEAKAKTSYTTSGKT
jgi:hypothetical protein